MIALALVALAPAVAHAGTYEVRLCDSGFSARNDNAAVLSTTTTCPALGGDPFGGLFAGVKPSNTSVPPGTTAGWTLAAPAGTTLTKLVVRRSFGRVDASYEVAARTSVGTVLDSCAVGCSSVPATVTYAPLKTASVAFTVRCTTSCTNSAHTSRAWLAIGEATATIDDTEPPLVTVAVGDWQRTPEVVVTSADASGIRAGGCDFNRLPPCPAQLRTTLTPGVPDGEHALTATATDAAGNTTVAPFTLKLDRVAPEAPIDLTVDGGVYTWRNPPSTAPIVAAHFSDGTVVRGEGIERAQAPSSDLSVWLEDAAGNVDPATAARPARPRAVAVSRPVLQSELRVSSTRRSGRTLTIRGVASARVTATLTRAGKTVRRSVRPRNGRWTIKLRVPWRGTYRLTVRSGGETVRKRVKF